MVEVQASREKIVSVGVYHFTAAVRATTGISIPAHAGSLVLVTKLFMVPMMTQILLNTSATAPVQIHATPQ